MTDAKVTMPDGTEKVVGSTTVVDGKSLFSTIKSLEKHFFRKGQAWGLSKAFVDSHDLFKITDKENAWTYEATSDSFKEHGWQHQFAGFEMQCFLGIDFWSINGKPPAKDTNTTPLVTEETETNPSGQTEFLGELPRRPE